MDGLTLVSSASSSTGDLQPQEDAWLTTYYKSAFPVSISRVNQVDAARLDIEMSTILKEQLVKVFSLMKLFKFGTFNVSRSWELGRGENVRKGLEGPGLTVAQKIWYCVATVDGQYMLAQFLARQAWLLIQRIEGIYKAASFSNLLLFLCTGRYRNLIERALRARLVYGRPTMNRAVSFEYMNCRLVWNEFSELLLLLLPLLNSSSIKNFLLPFSKDKSSDSSVDDTLCPICQGKPTIPFLAIPSQHRYCGGDILLVRSSCHPFGLTSFMCRFIALVLVTVVHVSFMYLHHYTATVTTVFKHGAPLLRLFVAPEVVNRLLLCNDMVVRSTTLVRYNNSLER
ncbi:hypothetical protein KY289_019366 [Solanum tuberosum]|nr:hypothetical protein KY289_019366 [Solanum tuberosum]